MAVSTSNVQPRTRAGTVRSNSVLFTRARTCSRGVSAPSMTIPILPSSAIRFKRMLQPIHPARRAVEASGVRFSTADSTKKYRGIRRRFSILHFGEYCITKRFGVWSERMEAIIAPYAASGIRVRLQPRPLLSSNLSRQRAHVKSQARELGGSWRSRSESQTGQ